MDEYAEIFYMSGGHYLLKCHTPYEANNTNYLDYTKKRDVNVPNVSEMEGNRLQDGVDIDAICYSSTLHQYDNIGCNNQ